MGQDAVDKVLARKPAESHVAAVAPPDAAKEGDNFYSALLGEGLHEDFLELRFRIGVRSCFSYSDLSLFSYDPDAGCIDLNFGSFLVIVKGRGLGDRLFNALKQKRVAWIKEADVEMEDHPGNPTFIEEITIVQADSDTQEEEPTDTQEGETPA